MTTSPHPDSTDTPPVCDKPTPRRPRTFATPGMVDAYNAGLPLRLMSELWHIFSPAGIQKRLRNSGVEMRPAVTPSGAGPNAQTVAHYRVVAELELPDLVKNPRAMASPGMVMAYTSGLTCRRIAELWGGMNPVIVRRQLVQADVKLRTPSEMQALPEPSAHIIEYFRKAAKKELEKSGEAEHIPVDQPESSRHTSSISARPRQVEREHAQAAK